MKSLLFFIAVIIVWFPSVIPFYDTNTKVEQPLEQTVVKIDELVQGSNEMVERLDLLIENSDNQIAKMKELIK